MRLGLNPILVVSQILFGFSFLMAAELPEAAPLSLTHRLDALAQQPPNPHVVLAEAQTRLSARISGVEELLANCEPNTQADWRTWLGLAELQAELATQAIEIDELQRIHKRLFGSHPGLEYAPVTALRTELGNYIMARTYADASSPSAWYRDQLRDLASNLQRVENRSDPDAVYLVGGILARLEPLSSETAALAHELRMQFCRDNAYAQVSTRLINTMVEQEIRERTSISDFVFGSTTRGTCDMLGKVSFDVAPSAGRGTLVVSLLGTATCPDLVASRRQVSVHSSSETSIRAEKRVELSDAGLTLLPATATCDSRMQLNSVDARSRLVESLAWRRASRLVPEAESHAARRAEREASTKLDEQANAALGSVNGLFCEKFRAPMLRLGALPEIEFSSNHSHLKLSLTQCARGQFAADGAPPEFAQNYDLGFVVHQSLITNVSESLLCGQTVRDEMWQNIVEVSRGNAPRELWVHDRAERWSVTFAGERPLTTQFIAGEILITMRLATVTRGETTFNTPIEVEIAIEPVVTEDGPVLARERPVEVRFPDYQDLSASQADELRAFLASKMGAFFPEELFFSGLVPPVGGSLEKLRQLKLMEFESRDGWLTLAYHLRSAEE